MTSCEIGLYVNTVHQPMTNPSKKKENEPDLTFGNFILDLTLIKIWEQRIEDYGATQRERMYSDRSPDSDKAGNC